jgi:hypothetical protein
MYTILLAEEHDATRAFLAVIWPLMVTGCCSRRTAQRRSRC